MPTPDKTRPEQLIASTMAAQFGLINEPQLTASGRDLRYAYRQVEANRWLIIHPKVFGLAGAPESFKRDVMAATLYLGEGSAAAGPTAAKLMGIDGCSDRPIYVATERDFRTQVPGLIVHRFDDQLPRDIRTVDGIPCTDIPRTLMDLGAVRPQRVPRALDEALSQRLVSLGQMWLFLDRPEVFGRRGVGVLRRALEPRTFAGRPLTHSDLEAELFERILAGGLPAPVRQHEVVLPFGKVHLDMAYPDLMINIEPSGYRAHSAEGVRENDTERDAELQAIGWLVLRFTWAQVTFRTKWVLDTIAAAIEHRRNHFALARS